MLLLYYAKKIIFLLDLFIIILALFRQNLIDNNVKADKGCKWVKSNCFLSFLLIIVRISHCDGSNELSWPLQPLRWTIPKRFFMSLHWAAFGQNWPETGQLFVGDSPRHQRQWQWPDQFISYVKWHSERFPSNKQMQNSRWRQYKPINWNRSCSCSWIVSNSPNKSDRIFIPPKWKECFILKECNISRNPLFPHFVCLCTCNQQNQSGHFAIHSFTSGLSLFPS